MNRAAAVLIVLAVVVAGCGTDEGDVSEPPLVTQAPGDGSDATSDDAAAEAGGDGTGQPSDDATVAETGDPDRSGAALIEQISCPSDIVRRDSRAISCGVASVPIDHAEPDGERTAIGIATLAGDDAGAARPLAVLQGGPGGASTEFAPWFSPQPFTQVFVDQRGTGFAGPDFNCGEFEDLLATVLGQAAEDAAPVASAAYGDCATRLRDDPVFASATTDTHALDVAAVMDALGYDDWSAYGVSYGSTIGLELLADAPSGLAGVVLDGVYPPDLDADTGIVFSAGRALDELDAACRADSTCNDLVGGQSVRELLERVMVDFASDPMVVPLAGSELALDRQVDVVLDGSRVADFSFLMLYQESLLRFLPAVLEGLDRRDPASAQWLASTGGRLFVFSQLANDEATYFAVQCHDRAPFTDGPGVSDDPFATAIVPTTLDELCAPWARAAASADVAEPVSSTIPALLLSGSFDPITPPDYAEDAAAGLSRSIVVEQAGRGHGIWNGSDCIASIVAEFVETPGEVLDTTCADDGAPVEWARP